MLLATTLEAQAVAGTATYYDDAGLGAGGTRVDARTEVLVAVPAA
jgi:hypothetical protein